ncbi:MAG: serine hydrolase domain-containing protein [Pseudomonadota bacterium]
MTLVRAHPGSAGQAVFQQVVARWAVLFDTDAGEVVQCFGEVELHEDTHVRLASVSKLVIGLVYARLVADRTLNPGQQVSAFVPEYAAALDALTLDDLACHNTGLQDALHDPAFRAVVNRDVTQPRPLEQVIQTSLALAPSDARPHYSNINAILLAQACERATGQPFPALVQRLAPVKGLTFSTDIDAPTGMRRGRADGAIEYGDTLFDASRYNPSWAGFSGTGTLRIGDIPAFCAGILRPLASATMAVDTGYRNLAQFEDGWACHSGDVPGASAWAGYHLATGRMIFAAAGMCWCAPFGNPAEAIAKASINAKALT